MSIRLRENHGFNLIHVQVMQIWHILSCELHGSPIALSKHEVCSFRDILILIHLLHAGTFRLSEVYDYDYRFNKPQHRNKKLHQAA